MTQRVMQGIIPSCHTSCQMDREFVLDPHPSLDSPIEWAEMGNRHRILVLAQGIEPCSARLTGHVLHKCMAAGAFPE